MTTAPPALGAGTPDDCGPIVEVVARHVVLAPVDAGTYLRGSCPFCQSRAFLVRPSHETFHCFRCGLGGTAGMFLAYMEDHQRGTLF